MDFLPRGIEAPQKPTSEIEQKFRIYLMKFFVELRKQRGFTIAKFCKKYGIPRATFYRVERGESVYNAATFLTIMYCENLPVDLQKIAKDSGAQNG